MEPLGNKIKKIRLEKDLKQSALHPNQSAIAQIEGGKNKKPSPTTIQTIAQSLEMTMEELVKDTDWKAPESMVEEGKYGYSELDFDLKILEDGKIEIQFRQYPRYDSNGLENKYCPTTSSRLLFECKKCKKPIASNKQIFCMGCGEKVFQSAGFKTMDEYFNKFNWSDYGLEKRIAHQKSLRSINPFDEILAEELAMEHQTNFDIEKDKTWIFAQTINNQSKLEWLISFLQIDSLTLYNYDDFRSFKPEYLLQRISEDRDKREVVIIDFEGINSWLSITKEEDRILDFDDYCKGIKAKNERIYNFHVNMEFQEKLYQKMADELKRRLNYTKDNLIALNEEEE